MNERPSLRISRAMQRIAAAVALSAYLVLTALGASLVFCHEADGNVSVEWSGAECCIEPGDTAPHAGEKASGSIAASSGGANCVECVDVPAARLLTSSAATERRASVPKPELVPCASALAARPETWNDRSETLFRGPPAAPSPPPRLAMLRTVVFRC